jgi:hypothetical protein
VFGVLGVMVTVRGSYRTPAALVSVLHVLSYCV